MEMMDAIFGRRSVRNFTDQPIPREIIRKVLQAAVYAPTGGNVQSWRFVVLEGLASINMIKAVSPGLLGNPPALIVIATDRAWAFDKGGELGRDVLTVMDAAMAAQNILLAAYNFGLGSCPIKSFNVPGLQKLLNLPEHIFPELEVSLGYPARAPVAPKRRPLDEVVYFDTYGGGLIG